MSVSRQEVGVAIREARLAADLSQDDLAGLMGLRQSAISQWESGATSPRAGHLVELLRRLDPWLIGLLLDHD